MSGEDLLPIIYLRGKVVPHGLKGLQAMIADGNLVGANRLQETSFNDNNEPLNRVVVVETSVDRKPGTAVDAGLGDMPEWDRTLFNTYGKTYEGSLADDARAKVSKPRDREKGGGGRERERGEREGERERE